MSLTWKWGLALSLALITAACGKKQEAPQTAETEATAAASAAAAPDAQPAAPAPAPAAPAEPAASSAVVDERAAAIQAALAEDAIVSDSRGQFAVSAIASSTYSADKKPESRVSYTPNAATGAPDVARYGDNGDAWTPETPDKGIEWLEVTFAKPVNATQIRIRQNFGPGAIIKIELIADDGSRHTVWQGVDDRQYPQSTITWFDRSFEKTAYKVTGARITLATNAVSGWNEIDAVQLLGD